MESKTSIDSLTLEPIEAKVVQAEIESDANDEGEEETGKLFNSLYTLYEIKIPILFCLIGLFFATFYSPYPDGFLRKGFIIGAIILFFCFKYFRGRH